MKTVLITGGAGFIGSALCLKLKEKGYRVIAFDNLSKQVHGDIPETTSPLFQKILVEGVEFIEGDIRDKELVKSVLINQGCEIIVHLAAETGTGQSMYQIEHYNSVNIGGTAILLDILANNTHSVEKIVVASSRSIYGEGKYLAGDIAVFPGHRNEHDMLLGDFEVKSLLHSDIRVTATDETSTIHPSSVYGITKQVQEQLVMTVCNSIGISAVALRYQNVYGPGQSLSNPYTGILSIFSNRILSGRNINIFEDGRESRDFVYIDDVVQATLLCIETEKANNQIYNVGTGQPTTVLEVARELMNNYGRQVPLEVTGNFRLGDIRHNFADIRKIQTDLGFMPKFNFSKGIRAFASWVQQQPLPEDKYEMSLEEMKHKGMFK